MRKEVEADMLEALGMDKELQISQLLGKLGFHPSGDPDLPQLGETSQGHPNQPNNKHHHSNSPRRSRPLKRCPQRGHQVANPQQHRRDNWQDSQVANQVANHHQGHLLDRQEARPRQQRNNNRHRHPMVAMGL